MKSLRELSSNVQGQVGQHPTQQNKAVVTEQVVSLVNNITKRFEGIYQYTGNRSQEKTNLYKAELTRALYLVRDKIDEQKINNAIKYFSLHGGAFAPSIPEFIQVVLGEKEELQKPPELKWFDSNKALPAHTPEQYQQMGKHGVEQAKKLLKKRT